MVKHKHAISLWQKQSHGWTLELPAFLPFLRLTAEALLRSHIWTFFESLPIFLRLFDQVSVP